MKTASYKEAVSIIALNDNSGNGDSVEDIQGYITTGLIADIFRVDVSKVARDIAVIRRKEGLPIRGEEVPF